MILRKRQSKSNNNPCNPCSRMASSRRRGERRIAAMGDRNKSGNDENDDGKETKAARENVKTEAINGRIEMRERDLSNPVSLKVLHSVLHNTPSVTALDLSWTNLGDENAATLCGMLEESTSLKELFLCGNGLGDSSTDYLESLLRNNKSIVKFHLGANTLGKEAVANLAGGLRNQEYLQELDLWNCSMGDEATAELLKNVPDAKALRVLRLNLNQLGPLSLRAATELLQVPTALEVLNLDSNPNLFGRQNEDEVAFIDTLAQNKTLRWLGIPYTGITDFSASLTFEALTRNQTLEYIDIGYNEIFKDGYGTMVKCIPQMKSLKHLRTHARAQLVSADVLSKAVEQNTSLQQFTSICVGCSKLWASLRRNQVLSRANEFVCNEESPRSALPLAIEKLASEKDGGASAVFQLLECYFR